MRRVSSVTELTSSKIAALARYWEAKRGRRLMPLWRDIDPAEIKPLLPHLLVSRYERNPFRVRYVLVGTWLAQFAGGDFTGRYLDELDFSGEDTDWLAHHIQFIAEKKPTFGICRFVTQSGLERDYESGMFPIAAEDGVTVERSLGIEDFPFGAEVTSDAATVAPSPRKAAEPAVHAAHETARLEPVFAGDAELRGCLTEAGLPIDDLAGRGKHYFRLVENGECLGYGGFEALGPHALLRSIVVKGARRGRGYGWTLVQRLIAELRMRRFDDAYLLTESAAPFFTALGFSPCPREEAPAAVAGTAQFSTLCPSSAKLMRLNLR